MPSAFSRTRLRAKKPTILAHLDPGVTRACAGLLRDALSADWRGTALETLIYHELRVWNAAAGKYRPISYYQTGSGAEIDFVVETRKRQPGTRPQVVCIEVKHATRWKRQWERAMRYNNSKSCIDCKFTPSGLSSTYSEVS